MEKSQFVCLRRDSNSCPNVRRFRGYYLNHRGEGGATIVFKISNCNKGTAAHRDACDTLWASGDAQTHTMYGYTYSKSKDQPGEVANPARGQLNRENEYFPVLRVHT